MARKPLSDELVRTASPPAQVCGVLINLAADANTRPALESCAAVPQLADALVRLLTPPSASPSPDAATDAADVFVDARPPPSQQHAADASAADGLSDAAMGAALLAAKTLCNLLTAGGTQGARAPPPPLTAAERQRLLALLHVDTTSPDGEWTQVMGMLHRLVGRWLPEPSAAAPPAAAPPPTALPT